uniref:(northern house mosquito) hypothetical protein n=1 Tax=Culex pipiens TaxID=7175 RepID=A0A8D8CEE8_CULPI
MRKCEDKYNQNGETCARVVPASHSRWGDTSRAKRSSSSAGTYLITLATPMKTFSEILHFRKGENTLLTNQKLFWIPDLDCFTNLDEFRSDTFLTRCFVIL